MSDTAFAPTTQVAPESTVKPEDVIEVLRQCFDPEIPVNIVDLGLIYDIAIKPERIDVKMTLTALGCPMAADVMADVRDHLMTLPGVKDAGVDIVYEPMWTPERMSEDARLGAPGDADEALLPVPGLPALLARAAWAVRHSRRALGPAEELVQRCYE